MTSSDAAVPIPAADRGLLSSWTHSSAPSAAARARIVLLAGQGFGTSEIARRAGVSRSTVTAWLQRYAEEGLSGLEDRPKPGRPRHIDEVAIVLTTLGPPPARTGVSRWSARLLGAELGIPFPTVARIWRKWGLRPWALDGFKFCVGPELDARMVEVVGLYLTASAGAVVVRAVPDCRAGESDRAAPVLPLRPGRPQVQAHELRPGAATELLAALAASTGQVAGDGGPSVVPMGSPAFLDLVAAAHPRGQLRVVAEDRGEDEASVATSWPGGDPRITVHQAATAVLWRDLVAVVLAVGCGQVGRGGLLDPATDLAGAVGAFLDGRAEGTRPLVWVRGADPVTAEPTADPVTTEPAAEPRPESDPSIRTLSRTTAELTAAIETLCKRLDTLESTIGQVGAWQTSPARPAAAVEALRPRPEASGSPDGRGRRPSAGAPPAQPVREAVLGADTRDVAMVNPWLLDRLELNTGPRYARGEISGSIAYGGIVQPAAAPGGVRWQAEHTVPDVMECDLRPAAVVLVAMGHPTRLELLRRMLLGASTVGELHDVAGVDTASKVHHHMRALRAGGLVVSHGRNHYTIPRDRVVPILLIVVTALGRRLVRSTDFDPAPIEESTHAGAGYDAQAAAPDPKFWLLDRLARNTGPGYTCGGVSGSIGYGVVTRMPSTDGLWWAGEFNLPDILDSDLPSAAVVLAALGHPLRLRLLRELLLGASTIEELQRIDGIGSSGQLHHHLRELRGAGFVVSAKRNHYAVPGDQIAYYLVMIAACVGRKVFNAAGPDPTGE
jgi:transposase/biotin operon repressor